jgi:hypothetical protein
LHNQFLLLKLWVESVLACQSQALPGDTTQIISNVIDQIVTGAVIFLEIPVLKKSTLLDSASDER